MDIFVPFMTYDKLYRKIWSTLGQDLPLKNKKHYRTREWFLNDFPRLQPTFSFHQTNPLKTGPPPPPRRGLQGSTSHWQPEKSPLETLVNASCGSIWLPKVLTLQFPSISIYVVLGRFSSKKSGNLKIWNLFWTKKGRASLGLRNQDSKSLVENCWKGLLHIPYRMYIYMTLYGLVYRKGMSQGKRLQIEMGNSIFAMIASAHDLAASQSCIEMDSTVSLTECMWKLGIYISCRNTITKQIRLVSFRHISYHLEEIVSIYYLSKPKHDIHTFTSLAPGAPFLLHTFWKAPLLLVAVWKLQMTSLVVAVSHPVLGW